MKLDIIIRRISAVLAVVLIYLFALSFYLGSKGFYFDPQDNSVKFKLNEANAAEAQKSLPMNIVLPWGHSLGSNKAKVTIYEYSSFGCSHCADFHSVTLPKLQKDYIDTGKVRLVFTPFPLDQSSLKAAVLADCVPASKYFDFANSVFEHQMSWGLSLNAEKSLARLAEPYGLSEEDALACMKNTKIAQEILNLRQEASKLINIQGTPTFVISSPKGREVYFGAMNYAKLQELINKNL